MHMESTQAGLAITFALKSIDKTACISQLSDKPEGDR